ncbi:hypothetical protein [Sphingomonas sp. R86521]|uniref:hypothetical protein n=1 Tax=Sphingomonas sp. R86521 TaxID=3093860 RepID=UPI0036D3751F
MKIRIDMTGLRYGRLVGVRFAHKSRSGHAHWLFACDCGNEVVAAGGNVRSGSTASCGCLHREISAARLTDHGHRARQRHNGTYRAWQRMKIEHEPGAISPVWSAQYVRFLADMGERPADTVLERIEKSRPFCSANCRWSSVASRAERATAGWRTRRGDAARQSSGLMAAINRSKSAPAAAATMRASIPR